MSTKRKAPAKFAQPAARHNAKNTVTTSINEADTAVSTLDAAKADTNGVGEDVIEISSDSGSSEYEFSDNEGAAKTTLETDTSAPGAESQNQISLKDDLIPAENGGLDTDMPSPNPPTDGESDQEPAAPTFGDLVRTTETIDVPAALAAQQPSALAASGKVIAPPSLSSLGTVLTQALRTDDRDLLESCLHTTDLATVRNTIQRLESSLAGTLLTKLASRMHRRPGRAGSLMAWVQWTLIAHGGALASQPGLVKKLSELNRVLEERSRGLSSLLALKGKLDLLEAQMQLRRSMRHNADSDDDSDDDAEEGIVYVEGQDSDAEMANGAMDLDDDQMPVTNGIVDDDSDDGEDYSEAEEDEELEGAEEIIDEDEVDHDDVESLGEDEDSERETTPPAKKRGKFAKQR
ncbi:Dip2/Utp12 family-domain-containing protein [Pseudomassariella vexata]|uniref:Dip2/Utp12 family-domain-containing protein n=1 Tax=Pseudomassariella vexata TaxID=1141098 RepID=A0A1Y2DXA2_9PEZI|nr:Dip2/Utp12 family-domain-containing protein [Pseudomassariella vexata]ORY63928.1 Dip2/Utp12 family-domain-containing protein [Pseudomassariella vexata]